MVLGAAILASCAGDGATPTTVGVPGAVESQASESESELADVSEPVAANNDGVVLMISGQIRAGDRSVSFNPTRSLPTAKDLTPEPGPFTLIVEGLDGQPLSQVAFDVIALNDTSEPMVRFSVAAPQPAEPMGRLTIRYEGDVVGSIDGNDSVPSVEIVRPGPGEAIALEGATFEWSGQGADGDELAYHVFFSADGGTSWTSVISGTDAESVRPAPRIVEASDDARLLVSVTDGVNASYAISEPFTVTG